MAVCEGSCLPSAHIVQVVTDDVLRKTLTRLREEEKGFLSLAVEIDGSRKMEAVSVSERVSEKGTVTSLSLSLSFDSEEEEDDDDEADEFEEACGRRAKVKAKETAEKAMFVARPQKGVLVEQGNILCVQVGQCKMAEECVQASDEKKEVSVCLVSDPDEKQMRMKCGSSGGTREKTSEEAEGQMGIKSPCRTWACRGVSRRQHLRMRRADR
ncbi:uncharacterized protein MONOS_18508 [Monocercomonoides exilis]|uniref:uncharacterized protein n=1 Tax=Monocercomonoides exilis TaxID=2049356 RepID=UPI0035595C1C|nr:hypothetical protein MONOS_18508 [Monocercomonoides exilis]